MSKRETPMTLAYWSRVGGTLIEEYVIAPPGAGRGVRLVDATILADGPTERLPSNATRHLALDGRGAGAHRGGARGGGREGAARRSE